jgi:hypothetical protein
MGIPPTICHVCGKGYWYGNEPHCVAAERELEGARQKHRTHIDMLDAIILAFRDRGEARQEILNAAFAFGHSTSKDEFRWLGDELEKGPRLLRARRVQVPEFDIQENPVIMPMPGLSPYLARLMDENATRTSPPRCIQCGEVVKLDDDGLCDECNELIESSLKGCVP